MELLDLRREAENAEGFRRSDTTRKSEADPMLSHASPNVSQLSRFLTRPPHLELDEC